MSADIRIVSDGNRVRMWVNGEEVEDMVSLKFEASVGGSDGCDIRCSYWKHARYSNGRYRVLNNEIITEQVIVSD